MVKLVTKLSADGERRYISIEMEEEFEGREGAIDAFEGLREKYAEEIGYSLAEVLCANMTLDMMVAVMDEEVARSVPFPQRLRKAGGGDYSGKNIGQVWDAILRKPGIIGWVAEKVPFDEAGTLMERFGIAACLVMSTVEAGGF